MTRDAVWSKTPPPSSGGAVASRRLYVTATARAHLLSSTSISFTISPPMLCVTKTTGRSPMPADSSWFRSSEACSATESVGWGDEALRMRAW